MSRRPRHPLWRLLAANLYDLRLLLQESWIALLGFVVVAAIGTLYLLFGYNDYANAGVARFSPLSALFETLRLLVFQSGLPLPQNDRLGQLLFFVIPLLGLALIFQSVLNFGRLLLDKGSRREAWQVALASTYRGHVVVCGLGRVGYRAISLLRETGHEVVVIERDWSSEFVGAAIALKVPVVLGDARRPEVLAQAGLQRARGVLTAIGNDLLNIEIALTARRERPGVHVVLRIFDDNLDSGMERSFGRNSAFSSSAVAAPTLAAAAVSRNIAHVLVHEGALLGLVEVVVESESQLSGFVGTLEGQFDVRVLHHTRGGAPVRNQLMNKLEGGDQVVLLGALDALERVRLANLAGSKLGFLAPAQLLHPTQRYNSVIICGLGRVGYRVLNQLQRMTPRPQIVVVTADGTRQQFLDVAAQMGVQVITGDARSTEVLAQAGLERAYALLAVTGSDLVNIQVGLAARRVRGDLHLVLRVFSDVLAARLAALFGIHTAYSTSELAAPTLAAGAILGDLSHAVHVGNQLLAQIALTVRPSDGLEGRSIAEVREQQGALVLAVRRGDARPTPTLDTRLLAGDEITLLAPLEVLARLRASHTAVGATRLIKKGSKRGMLS